MSLKITKTSGTFDLPNDFNIEIEDMSPLYNERGSQSIAATLPASRSNLALVNHIHRIDADHVPTADDRVVVSDGVYNRIGKMNITQASRSGGIVSNIGFDESEIYSIWNAVSLRTLEAPILRPGSISAVITLLEDIMNETHTEDGLAVFPICVTMPSKTETVNEKEVTTYYPEYINKIAQANGTYYLVANARKETFLLDNEPVLTSVPEGYGITAFLKVPWLLNFIFNKYGYTVTENPFSTHPQLSRLVVLNNMADACVKGFLNYSDLMPDCTINEFLQALYCRFGMVYFVDGKTKSVKLKLIKDLISTPATKDWSLLKAAIPVINYNSPQQLKLSAGTTIAGPYQDLVAAPETDSLDKFLKPFNYVVSSNYDKGYLYYSNYNGVYTVRNIYTKQLDARSSDFFPWDKGSNIGYMDISSVDECLPVKGSRPDSQPACPAYLLGKIHKYTNIASADIELSEEQNTQTPLCFCFAFPRSSASFPYGSPRCYHALGDIVTTNGHTFDISMTFIGENGLFNRFWKGFDAVLRYANHSIEASLHLNHNQLLNSDFSQIVNLDGQRLLLDNFRYTLPRSLTRPTTVYLRTLKLLAPFGQDIDKDKDQGIHITEQLYQWAVHNNRENVVDVNTYQQIADWKKWLLPPAVWLGLVRKNEVTDQVSDVEIPFTIPTQEDFDNQQEYYIKKLNYSFDLYYKVRVPNGQTSSGVIIWKEKEYGNIHYDLQYDLSLKAELL